MNFILFYFVFIFIIFLPLKLSHKTEQETSSYCGNQILCQVLCQSSLISNNRKKEKQQKLSISRNKRKWILEQLTKLKMQRYITTSGKYTCYEYAGRHQCYKPFGPCFKCSIGKTSISRFGLWKSFKFPKERITSVCIWSNTNPFSQVSKTQVTLDL